MNQHVSAQTLGRSITASITLAATIITQLAVTPAQAAAARFPTAITITANIPAVGDSLPLYRLGNGSAPTAFVQSTLAAMKASPLAMEKSRFVARNGKGAVRAFVDSVHGDAQVFPDLAATGSAAVQPQVAHGVATNVFNRADVIPKDATVVKLGNDTPVFANAASRPEVGAAPQAQSRTEQLFTYVNAMRFAHGLPVYGKGSQASVAVAGDGSIRGLVRRWRPASVAGNVARTTTPAQLVAAIDAQLRQFQNGDSRITVNSIIPAYYDGDGAYLQPVYIFMATLHGGRVSDDHVAGYVPFGNLVESIPVLGAKTGAAPVAPSRANVNAARPMNNGSYITFGEYANRDGAMLDMANAYNNGYAQNSPWWAPAISRTEWFWAYPGTYVGASANWNVNSVNVAYTQPHGDWWLNTTYSNWADLFYINNIGTGGNPGYGAASGGSLATWIIDSCEVVPSYYDLQVTTGNGFNAFTPWWPVFQGLHRVLGFRTEMLLGMDDMNYAIAKDQASGADVVSAFWNDIAAVNFPSYYNGHLNLNTTYDRASVIYDTRNGGESIYAVQGQSAAGQLRNIWMGN